jgi:hypothetical protein
MTAAEWQEYKDDIVAAGHARDDEAGSDEADEVVAVGDGFGEVVAGVDVEEGEGHASRVEGFASEPCHDDGVFTAGEEEGWVAELCGGFAEDVDGFRFQLLEVTDLVAVEGGHGGKGWRRFRHAYDRRDGAQANSPDS